MVLSFKKYSCNTQLCTAALGRTNWRRIVLPPSLSVHTNGITHSRQNKCYAIAAEKVPTCNQWACRNEDCTRQPHNTTKVASGNFFLKIMNCRDQLSEGRTVFLYLYCNIPREIKNKCLQAIHNCPRTNHFPGLSPLRSWWKKSHRIQILQHPYKKKIYFGGHEDTVKILRLMYLFLLYYINIEYIKRIKYII